MLEILLSLVIILGGAFLSPEPVQGLLESLALRGFSQTPPDTILEQARHSSLLMVAGGLALLAGRLVSSRRPGAHLPVPLLVPATLALVQIGWFLQLGYGNPLRGSFWPGPDFAGGVLIGGIAGGLLLAQPWDPMELARRARWYLLAGILLIFLALGLFGSGPQGSGVRINLGPFQPIEVAKLGFVAFLAHYLGERTSKLRYQRDRAGFLRFPRPKLLIPAFLFLAALFLGLFAVGDLGPTLVLAAVFLVLFYLVTRSPGWILGSLALVLFAVLLLRADPEIAGSSTLALRLRMWTSPWLNGLPNGDQLATSRWAIAAGSWFGQGLGHGALLPAGHTDLVSAHLAEELGLLGVFSYLLLLGIVAFEGLGVAARNRTPERALFAAGLVILLLSQWLVIAGGTLGLVPLTGIVVPFLSFGKSSMVAFLVLVALIAKMAESGRCHVETDDLVQLRVGSRVLSVGVVVVSGASILAFYIEGVLLARSTSLRGVVTTLADGSVAQVYNPRLQRIAAQLPRGQIRDREGAVLAGSDPDGCRLNPLGAALGTLLGPSSGDVLRPRWCLERTFDSRLRGYGERPDGPSAWLAPNLHFEPGTAPERLLFVAPSRAEEPQDRARALAMAKDLGLDPLKVRLLPLPLPDYGPLVELLYTPFEERQQRIGALSADLDSRSLRISLDSKLQLAAVKVLREYALRGKAAAAVILDVDSGQVLARAQVPDYDPSDPGWRESILSKDPAFLGAYGPWSDKTGLRGIFQAGSVGKVFTALVSARQGMGHSGQGCSIRGTNPYTCARADAQGPMLLLPGWPKPIHDHHRDGMHGTIDITDALSVSCNVFFAQLGLAMGPEAFEQAWADGLEMGWGAGFDPGPAGSRQLASTAFGQGTMAFSVTQAARMMALVGSGGIYRRCPSTLELDAPCVERRLVLDQGALQTILTGLRRVMDRGTARGLRKIDGVRIYGKTGTADSIGLREEAPYGIVPGDEKAPPHSWFVALAEPASHEPCQSEASGRLAFAVVIPRGGAGSKAAGPATVELIAAARALGYLRGSVSGAAGSSLSGTTDSR